MAGILPKDHFVLKIERDLSALNTCDLITAWVLLKDDIERQIGKDKYACIPYITDGSLYDVTSIFVKTKQSGGVGDRVRTYLPLGKIEDLLIQEKSYKVWHDMSERVPPPVASAFPSPFELTLNDEANQIRVTAIFHDFSKRTVPREFSPVGQVRLNVYLAPHLNLCRRVYFINEVVLVNSIEIRVNVKEASGTYLLSTPQPIAFHYAKYRMTPRKTLILKVKVPKINSKKTNWIRVSLKADVQQEASTSKLVESVSADNAAVGTNDEDSALDPEEVSVLDANVDSVHEPKIELESKIYPIAAN